MLLLFFPFGVLRKKKKEKEKEKERKKEHTFPKTNYRIIFISRRAGENLRMIPSRRNERAGVCSATGQHLSGMCEALPSQRSNRRKTAFR